MARKEEPPVSLFSPFPGKQRPLGKNSRRALPLAAVKKENIFTLKTENKNRNTATAVVVLAVAAVLLAIDQMLKYFVLRDLRPVGTVTVIPGLLELTYVENTGAALWPVQAGDVAGGSRHRGGHGGHYRAAFPL